VTDFVLSNGLGAWGSPIVVVGILVLILIIIWVILKIYEKSVERTRPIEHLCDYCGHMVLRYRTVITHPSRRGSSMAFVRSAGGKRDWSARSASGPCRPCEVQELGPLPNPVKFFMYCSKVSQLPLPGQKNLLYLGQ